MIGLGYSNVFSFDPQSGDFYDKVVVPGRVALTSLSVHTKAVDSFFTINPLVLKNGSDTGDIRYKFSPWSVPDFLTTGFLRPCYQVFMGGAGILFEDGIHFNWVASGTTSSMGVDNVVLFYVGPPGLVP